MARFRRLVVPGFPHHITQRGVRRQTTFFDERDYRTYLRLAGEFHEESAVRIWTYCLMPNHMHAVVIPETQQSLAKFFGKLHKAYAHLTNMRYEWSGHLWQNRYFSVVMDEPHTMTAMRYVERNPVRSGLVDAPEDWPWSSARGNLGQADDPLLPRRPADGVVTDWRGYISGPEDDARLAELRRHTGTGRPAGSADFLDALENRTGRRIRPRTPGRKKKSGD